MCKPPIVQVDTLDPQTAREKVRAASLTSPIAYAVDRYASLVPMSEADKLAILAAALLDDSDRLRDILTTVIAGMTLLSFDNASALVKHWDDVVRVPRLTIDEIQLITRDVEAAKREGSK